MNAEAPATPAPAPAPKPLTAKDKKTILGFNKDWNDKDRAAISKILDDDKTVVTGFRVSKNADYIRLASGGKSVAWINKNHVDLPGGKKVDLSTPVKAEKPAAAGDSVI